MRIKIFYIILLIISLKPLAAQDTLNTFSKGFDINNASILSRSAFTNTLISYNFGKNRIGIGLIALNLIHEGEEKILGFNINYNKTILQSKHFDFYVDLGFSYFNEKTRNDDYGISFYLNNLDTYTRLRIDGNYGFRYFPSGKWFYFTTSAGISYNTLEQTHREKKRLDSTVRIGIGALLFNRKYISY